VPPEPGKPKRKLPERADALRINLPFDQAIEAALKATPDDKQENAAKKRTQG
jgi:hypothetical protein